MAPTSSEDVTSLQSQIAEYLQLQRQIRSVINSGQPCEQDQMVEDIVDAISKLSPSSHLLDVFTIGVTVAQRHYKRKKLKQVVNNILSKIFDVTLKWYAMDYQDLKQTCDYFGGKNYFSEDDYSAIYKAVLQKLKQGPIRDKCIRLGLTKFVNKKISDITDNFLEFKEREL